MMRSMRLVALFAAVPGLSGCRSAVLQKDQDRFRQVILDSYTNQIMDNVIRTANGMPIVVVDYTNITGTVTDMGSAGATPSQVTTDDTKLAFGAILRLAQLTSRTVERMFQNTAAWSVNASRMSQLSVTGTPVIDHPDVYRAYLEFVDKPGRLVRDCNPPPPGVAHITRKVGKDYFFVPVEYRRDFFELALKTTVMRGEPTAAQEVYTVAVKEATLIPPDPLEALPSDNHSLRITLDRALPNDSGTLKLVDGPTPYIMKIANLPGPPTGSNTTFTASYVETKNGIPLPPDQVIAMLKKAKSVDITLLHNRPTTTSTDAILKSIFNQNQLNRLDTLSLLNRRVP
jgi:hypothetical protein